jgi:glycosyltransferase involved in cell wall biosynthesis
MSEPLRVLVFMHCAGLAGAERSVLELVHQLRVDHDVAVTVVLPYDGPMRVRLAAEGAQTLLVETGWWCEFDRHRLSRSAATLLEAIRERPADFDADVVITMSITIPWGALAASVLRKPHVWYLRETGDYQQFVLPFDRVVGLIDESSNAVIAISHAVRRVLAEIADDKVSIVMPSFAGIEERAHRDGACERPRPRLVYPGTKSEQKGQEDAIRAVAALASRGRDVELVLVGPGPDSENERLAAMAAELGVGDRVEISGFRDDVLAMIADADIMVDCTREPALGRVIIEAMLIGTPVVATRSGGAIELCRDGAHGVPYTVGDAGDLARAIETILDDPAETAAMVRRARDFATTVNRRDRYGAVVFEKLRSLVGVANPTPRAWSGFILDLMTQADVACRAALADAERATAERDEARAASQGLAAAHASLAAEHASLTVESRRLAAETERIEAERTQALGAHDRLLDQYRHLQREHDGLSAEYDRRSAEHSEAVRALNTHIAATEATIGWRALRQLTRVRDRLLPLGTRRRRLYSWVGRTFSPVRK